MTPEPFDLAAALNQVKAETGVSWAKLADIIGASSGDYVRKVAAGAKPGRNLIENVRQLMATGSVEKPAPRRTTKAGTPARVRAKPTEPGGRPSKVPTVRTRFEAAPPTVFAGPNGKLGTSHRIEVPRTGAVGRWKGREEILRLIQQAKANGKRLSFRVETFGSNKSHQRGGKGGYDPERVLRNIEWEDGDPFAWLAGEFDDEYEIKAGDIAVVTVEIW